MSELYDPGCHLKGSHSGHCMICLWCGTLCYQTNVFEILKRWGVGRDYSE